MNTLPEAIRIGNFYPPQVFNREKNRWELIEGSDGAYKAQTVEYVSAEYFEGNGNLKKEFAQEMHGISILNGGDTDMRFIINGMSRPVLAKGTYEQKFKEPFSSIQIIAAGAWYIDVLQRVGTSVAVDPSTPDAEAPENVTDLAYHDITQNSVRLTWTASVSTDTAGYQVWRGGSMLATVTNTEYSASGLTASTQYTYTIKAVDHAGNVASGTSITVTTAAEPGDNVPPNNVTGLEVSNVTQTGVTLTWQASTSEDVKDYRIYKGAELIATVTGLSYEATGLVASTDYTFTVKARDTSNNEASGVSVPVKTAGVPPVDVAPEPVTNLAAGTPTTSSIPLTWVRSVSSNVDKYEVAYSTNGIDFTIASSSVNSSSSVYTVTGLAAETAYTLRVVAISTTGKRSAAVTVQVSTAAEIPTPQTAVIYEDNSYLVMPVTQFTWSFLTGYDSTNFMGLSTDYRLQTMFSQSYLDDNVLIDDMTYHNFIANMTGVAEECYTICNTGSPLGKVIMWLSKTKGATASELINYIKNSGKKMKIKTSPNFKTLAISTNISNVTTRTASVDPAFEYFKCTLNDGIGSYDPSVVSLTIWNFASNGYKVVQVGDYVFSRTFSNLRVNADGTLEMLLPKGTIGTIDLANVQAYLADANLKIYY